MKKRGYDMCLLENVIHMLATNPRLKPGIYVCVESGSCESAGGSVF
ncbi:MAG: hypothetical protein LUG27_10160 [Clostridiales bacterium]|nr:hypothetical protein [Clostridiales bacterium]